MIFTIVAVVVLLQLLICWSSWYRKTFYKWVDCRCGRAIELHRKKHYTGECLVWEGQCDRCYNHTIEWIN